jgi:hypothetical protein
MHYMLLTHPLLICCIVLAQYTLVALENNISFVLELSTSAQRLTTFGTHQNMRSGTPMWCLQLSRTFIWDVINHLYSDESETLGHWKTYLPMLKYIA